MIKSTQKPGDNQTPGRKVKIAKPAPKPVPERKKLRYKKVTGGIFFSATKQPVRKNEIFLAYPEEIPAGFASSFICLDEITASADPGIKVGLAPAGKNCWNVINILTGDILNDSPLDATSAKAFLEEGQSLPTGPEPLEPPEKKSTETKGKEPEEKEDDEEEYDD